jgi:transcriptional regulator CtsR
MVNEIKEQITNSRHKEIRTNRHYIASQYELVPSLVNSDLVQIIFERLDRSHTAQGNLNYGRIQGTVFFSG